MTTQTSSQISDTSTLSHNNAISTGNDARESDDQYSSREPTTEPRTSPSDSDVTTEPDDQYPGRRPITESKNSFDGTGSTVTDLAFSNGPEAAHVNQAPSHAPNIVIGVVVSVVILVIIGVGVVYVYCKRKVRSKKYYGSYCPMF